MHIENSNKHWLKICYGSHCKGAHISSRSERVTGFHACIREKWLIFFQVNLVFIVLMTSILNLGSRYDLVLFLEWLKYSLSSLRNIENIIDSNFLFLKSIGARFDIRSTTEVNGTVECKPNYVPHISDYWCLYANITCPVPAKKILIFINEFIIYNSRYFNIEFFINNTYIFPH